MDAVTFRARLDYFALVHGVTRRAIGTFTDAELDFRPRAGMRSPRELIMHIYAQSQAMADAVQRGTFDMAAASASVPEDPAAAPALARLATVADAQAYADACHGALDRFFRALSDDDLARRVDSPMGALPAWQFFAFAYDEHWHHRGQLYTYLRLLGKEAPMLYDYQPDAP